MKRERGSDQPIDTRCIEDISPTEAAQFDVRRIGEIPTVKEIVRFVEEAGSDDLPTFGGTHVGGIHIQQVPDEIAPCIRTILESGRRIKSYLEVGVASGGTTFLLNHYFRPETIVLVDDGKHWKAHLREGILADVPHTFLRGHSSAPEMVGAVAEVCPDFDLIMVDAGHSYEAVKADVEAYLPFLRPGGFLVLHDSALPEWGILRLAGELKEDESLSFIAEYVSATHPRPCGVALFRRAR